MVSVSDTVATLALDGASPLSAAQARLWEIEAAGDERGMHTFALAHHLDGPVDAGVLENALRAVVRRHPALRVRVDDADGSPRFVDAEPHGPRLGRARLAAGHDVDAWLRAEAARPIDLAAGPGWRCTLLDHDGGAELLLHLHHVIADRWSAAVLVTDLGAAYRALLAGEPPLGGGRAERAGVPRPAPIPDEDVQAGLAYWRATFASPAAPLSLPDETAGARAFGAYAGDRVEGVLDRAAVAALKAIAADAATTPYAVLLAAFAALLRAHTGQEDLVLCTAMTGRHHAGARAAIGYFNNVVPLRLDAGGDPTFAELTARVAGAARAAAAHQDVPLQLVAALPELSDVRTSRCLFALQNIPGLDLRLPGVRTSRRDVPGGLANFDLSVFLEEVDGELRLLLDFKTAVLSADAVVKLRDRYVDVLRRIAADPSAPLSAFPRYDDGAALAVPNVPGGPRRTLVVRSMVEQRMIEAFRALFPRTPTDAIHAESDFFALGGDSIRAARLMTQIRREFGRVLPLATLFEAATPRRLVARLADRHWVEPWLALVPLRPAGTRPPLFCIAGGGGNVINYRALATRLGGDQPVYCLQARGLRPGERALHSVEEMAAHYLEAVRRLRPHGPYLLVGHSLGAAVAFEMARRFVDAGEAVPFLGMLDHAGPDVTIRRIDWLRLHLMSISMLTPRERVTYARRALTWRAMLVRRRVLGARAEPVAARASAADASIDLLQRSLEAIRRYEVKPFAGRVTLFRAGHGSVRTRADRHGGWRRVALGGVDVHDVPGTHMGMLDEPHVRVLAEALVRSLDACASSG
ncbi:MAG: alpha/beta fold hydrolase [Gemmatirosa sp.]|nr:alpha/beta fold hydrolase [Gemmatirosa sp.]